MRGEEERVGEVGSMFHVNFNYPLIYPAGEGGV